MAALSAPEATFARERARELLAEAGLVLRPDEVPEIEIADFGLGNLKHYGLQIVVYINTDRCCAKELVMFPGQICPEHRHPPLPQFNDPGKEETFRCRWGMVYLYLPGVSTAFQNEIAVLENDPRYTVLREVVLEPGDQITIPPDTPHWFQAGGEGAVISEFSTTSRDEFDIFTDPQIQR